MNASMPAVAPRRVARIGKDVIERALATVLLVVLAPLLAVLALLVAASAGAPVFHRRRVVGLHGIAFDAFKFRTMVVGAEQLLHAQPALRREFDAQMKLRADPRLTRVGRFLRRTSLDELPQLVNVVRGQMSLVGPRMIAPGEMPKFGPALGRRLAVKPGITGLWQVSGRQELGYEDRVRLDLYYIEHWSLWLDLAILARTIPAVLSMRGAY